MPPSTTRRLGSSKTLDTRSVRPAGTATLVFALSDCQGRICGLLRLEVNGRTGEHQDGQASDRWLTPKPFEREILQGQLENKILKYCGNLWRAASTARGFLMVGPTIVGTNRSKCNSRSVSLPGSVATETGHVNRTSGKGYQRRPVQPIRLLIICK
jgi:hypothetical protein